MSVVYTNKFDVVCVTVVSTRLEWLDQEQSRLDCLSYVHRIHASIRHGLYRSWHSRG